MSLPAAFRDDRFKGWLLLAALQAVVALALLHDYIFGERFFAFMDVGSDTMAQYVPQAMHLASPANWASAWSFNVGLGGLAPMIPSPFMLLGIAGGPENVLGLRIWVYLSKIFFGGAAMYGFALAMGTRRETALLVALAYSFCGHAAIDSQWDSQSTEFATYPLILWALARHRSRPGPWAIPLSIAFAAYNGIFMFSVGVFIAYVFVATCAASARPREAAEEWIRQVLPLVVIGLLLSAPMLLPAAFQMLDSPRVTGAQSEFIDRLRNLMTLNDKRTILAGIAGLFQKNLLGIGNLHSGWMNYLEGPGFYVGMLALLMIPQLLLGSKLDRRVFVAGTATLAFFILAPAIRSAAFGFGLDYFRVNNLWVSMLLLSLFARALEVVARQGVDKRVLGGTVILILFAIWNLQTWFSPRPSYDHLWRIGVFLLAGLLLLLLLGRIGPKRFAAAAVFLVAAEAIVVNYPSFHATREVVTRAVPSFGDDGTVEILAYLRSRDPGFYRVEKTYRSVSLCDALGQGYMGVKSYWFHSSSIVRFFMDLELIGRRGRFRNFTNWLPNFGDRFVLNTLAGVKYVITKEPVNWAGFQKIHQAGELSVYENRLALPLGVVQERQIPVEQFSRLSAEARDITLINAVVVDSLRGGSPALYDPRQLSKESPSWLDENYSDPARRLQGRGLVVEKASPGQISGVIRTDVPGTLVFSIPYSKGWSVRIDGAEAPTFVANLGMTATDIGPGAHRVELRFSMPGLVPGLLLALLGLTGLAAFAVRSRHAPDGRREGGTPVARSPNAL